MPTRKKLWALVALLSILFSCGLAAQDFPEFSAPRDVTTIHEGGAWHFKNGVRRDNQGDFTMGVVTIGDQRYYVLMIREGGNPKPIPGGAFWWKLYDGDPYTGWHQDSLEEGGTPHHVQALPHAAPLSRWNIDTHAWAQNPLTQTMIWVHGVKPGTAPGPQTFAIQWATSTTISSDPSAYTRHLAEVLIPSNWGHPVKLGNGKYWGGAAESSLAIDPQLAVAFLYWTDKTRENPDAFGVRHRSRVNRATISLANIDTDPQVTRGPVVFDPVLHGADGDYGTENATSLWGTANTILQQSVTILPDGTHHLVAHGKRPFKRADGTPAKGRSNRTDAFGHWWSPHGIEWRSDTGNPLFNKAYFGIDETLGIANQMNSPHTWVDPWAKKFYFACSINRTGEQNKLGTRLVLMEAPLSW